MQVSVSLIIASLARTPSSATVDRLGAAALDEVARRAEERSPRRFFARIGAALLEQTPGRLEAVALELEGPMADLAFGDGALEAAREAVGHAFEGRILEGMLALVPPDVRVKASSDPETMQPVVMAMIAELVEAFGFSATILDTSALVTDLELVDGNIAKLEGIWDGLKLELEEIERELRAIPDGEQRERVDELAEKWDELKRELAELEAALADFRARRAAIDELEPVEADLEAVEAELEAAADQPTNDAGTDAGTDAAPAAKQPSKSRRKRG